MKNKVAYHNGKRLTAKGYCIVQHPLFGRCALLCQEADLKYGLLGGGMTQGELPHEAFSREISEELGDKLHITYTKELGMIETDTKLHHIFLAELSGVTQPKANEILGFCFYPLESGLEKERKILENNMTRNALRAMQQMMEEQTYSSCNVSNITIADEYVKKFEKDLYDMLHQ